jgi:hypothetical protein
MLRLSNCRSSDAALRRGVLSENATWNRQPASTVMYIIFSPEDGGSMFAWNISEFSCTAYVYIPEVHRAGSLLLALLCCCLHCTEVTGLEAFVAFGSSCMLSAACSQKVLLGQYGRSRYCWSKQLASPVIQDQHQMQTDKRNDTHWKMAVLQLSLLTFLSIS